MTDDNDNENDNENDSMIKIIRRIMMMKMIDDRFLCFNNVGPDMRCALHPCACSSVIQQYTRKNKGELPVAAFSWALKNNCCK